MNAHRSRVIAAFSMFFVTLVLFGSCTVREEMVLSAAGSGEAAVSVNMHPVLIAYFADLMAAMTGVEEPMPIFNLDQLTASFEQRPGVRLLEAAEPERGSLRLRVAFDDVGELLAGQSDTDALRFSRSGTRRTLRITLDREAVNRFLGFAPEESRTMADLLLPPPDGTMTIEEYREVLAWSLEEYAGSDEVLDALDRAMIEVAIRPEGNIVSQTGGEVRGNAVVFRVPVMELLTLQGELVYSLSFVP
jgi:hypothetical protein